MNSEQLTTYMMAAREAAILAWKEIERFFQGKFEIHEKENDGPATEADILADHFIVDYLRARFPNDDCGFLTEETQKGRERLGKPICWIVDPIDGTREFIQGRDDFAMHIGLAAPVVDGGPYVPLVGVVYEPRAGILYRSAKGQGAFAEDTRTGSVTRVSVSAQTALDQSTIVITRQQYGPKMESALTRLNPLEINRRGSFGVKTMDLVRCHADIYLNTARRRCKEWDTCAPHAILDEAGGRLTDLAGHDLTYNNEDYYIEKGALATNRHLHDAVLGRLGPLNEWWDV